MAFKNFIQIVLLSFYSSDLYITVALKWKYWGARFLMCFSLIASIIISILSYSLFSSIDVNDFDSLLNGFPELVIKQGKAEPKDSDAKLPFIVKYPANKDLVVVDLNDSNIGKYGADAIVFTKDKINVTSSSSVAYNSVFEGIVDQETIVNLLQKYKFKLLEMILILGVPLGSLLLFAFTFLKSMFFASIATFISILFKYNLNFQQLTRIAVVVNVPAFFLNLLLVPLFFVIGLADIGLFIFNNLYLFYFTYAFIICAKNI